VTDDPRDAPPTAAAAQGSAGARPEDLARAEVAIIGAGVVGCALARRFTLEGAKVLVLEKARDILDGASKGNSGILHTGFDAPPGSLEQACIAEGYREYCDIRRAMNLPLLETGALVIAWSEEEEARLPALMEQARANGVTDVEALSAAQIRALEPNLAEGLRGGFRVPWEFVIDPWSAPHAYLLQALENGARLLRDTALLGAEFEGEEWRLETSRGLVRARTVINCAGLQGDRVEALLLGGSSFEIRPRKGQFVVFDKLAARLVTSIILPVPTETTKGIVVCRTAFGNLLVGPTAEEQESREEAAVEGETLALLQQKGAQILPALAGMPVTAAYAGLRPASEKKEYRIRAEAARRYIGVGGIRSTGLSAALGIARYVFGLYEGFGQSHEALSQASCPRLPTLTEEGERGWAQAGNGGVVCHCELVTRREIEAALSGPLAARSLAGLKRRTRVTMGRCQGFYCLSALAEIVRERLAPPIAEACGDAHGDANGDG
jgi:glycerol-3-phosphate dehydrogenase